jgi:hypothetical protein
LLPISPAGNHGYVKKILVACPTGAFAVDPMIAGRVRTATSALAAG